MKQIKVSEATPIQLDWLVATCEGYPNITGIHQQGRIRIVSGQFFNPSTDWSEGGPLIQSNLLCLSPDPTQGWRANGYMDAVEYFGPTPLIAAMRCYVASKLGNVVEIPEELE